ncbi:MAG: hypothetical protein BJ554DRAFT_5759, partial [Olpidium bornovanus]
FGQPDLVLVLDGDNVFQDGLAEGLRVGRPLAAADEEVVPVDEFLESPPRGVAGAGDADGLEDPASPQLVQDHGRVEAPRLLLLVGLDAADVVHVRAVDGVHQGDQGRLEHRAQPVSVLEQHGANAKESRAQRQREHFPHELEIALLQHRQQLVGNRVLVLLDEPLRLVGDLAGVVVDGEGGVGEPRLGEDLAVLRGPELLVELVREAQVRSRRQPRLLVEEREDAQLALDHLDGRRVVAVVYERPLDLLLDVELLLQPGRGYLQLQLLVRVVYAELFERILLKVLEPVNVQHPDERVGLLQAAGEAEAGVDDAHEPVEHVGVHVLRHGVPDGRGGRGLEVGHDPLGARGDLPLDEPLAELGRVDAEEPRGVAERLQRGQEPEDLPLQLHGDPDRRQGALRDLELGRVVDPADVALLALVQVVEVLERAADAQLFLFRRRRPGDQLVEYVIVPLRVQLEDQARALKKVRPDFRTDDGLVLVEGVRVWGWGT